MQATSTDECVGRVLLLDPSRVRPFADQPRKRFRGIPQLAGSIQAVGQVTPIVVTAVDDDPNFDAELVDGERRLRACVWGGMKVRAVFEDEAMHNRYVHSIAANFCRQSHDAVEIMEAVLTLKDAGSTSEEIAKIFGTTVTWVSQYASLQKLSPVVLDELKIADDKHKESGPKRRGRGRVTLSIALLLVPLPRQQQLTMLNKIRAGKMSMAQARTFVKREAMESGIRVGQKRSPHSQFKAISSAVENCSHVVDRYINMPGAEIATVMNSASRTEKKNLSERLEKLCEYLLAFSDALGTPNRVESNDVIQTS